MKKIYGEMPEQKVDTLKITTEAHALVEQFREIFWS